MESIQVEISIEKLKVGLEKAVDEVFKCSYNNPVTKLLEDAIKAKDGQIKLLFDDIISKALDNPEFKEKISQTVISRLVESALKRS